MSAKARVFDLFAPWRVAAVVIVAPTLTMSLLGRAEAAIGVTALAVNDNVAGNATDLSFDVALDFDLAPGDTITVTFPVGWVVADGDVTGTVSWAGLVDVAPTIEGDAGLRTVTTTIAAPQDALLPLTMTVDPQGGDLTNPAVPLASR